MTNDTNDGNIANTLRQPDQHGDIVGVSLAEQQRLGLHRSALHDIVEGKVEVGEEMRREAAEALALSRELDG